MRKRPLRLRHRQNPPKRTPFAVQRSEKRRKRDGDGKACGGGSFDEGARLAVATENRGLKRLLGASNAKLRPDKVLIVKIR